MLNEGRWLVLDSSGLTVQVGLFEGGRWLAFERSEEAPLEALFESVDRVLRQADARLDDLRGFVLGSGPGSLLGIRLAAMAIRTWQSLRTTPAEVLQYESLALAAAALSRRCEIVSDFKKGAWNHIRGEDGDRRSAIDVLDDAAVAALEPPLYHIAQRKGWSRPPAKAEPLDYSAEALAQVWNAQGLLQRVDLPTPFSHGSPQFARWVPERHRA